MDKEKKSPGAAIITWCYDNGKTNYGQILQCYAMQELWRKMGYRTKIVRYRRRDREETMFLEKRSELGVNLYELWYRLKKVEKNLDMRIVRFIAFIKKYISLSEQCYTKKQVEEACGDCEVLVCGSDQIWNPEWFQDIYALNFGEDRQKRIAYAPSGVFVENERNENVYRDLGKYLDHFDLVTVREKDSIEILKKYTRKRIVDVPDPTLLVTQTDWNRVAAKHVVTGPYIFCYSLGKLRKHKVLLKHIMKKYGANKVMFLVSGFYEKEDELEKGGYFYPLEHIGPSQFIALIRDARAVCTDSFHGLALSVVYRKQFFVFDRIDPRTDINANTARQRNLLEKIGIGNERFVRCVRDMDKIEEIDYEKVQLETRWDEIKALLGSVL